MRFDTFVAAGATVILVALGLFVISAHAQDAVTPTAAFTPDDLAAKVKYYTALADALLLALGGAAVTLTGGFLLFRGRVLALKAAIKAVVVSVQPILEKQDEDTQRRTKNEMKVVTEKFGDEAAAIIDKTVHEVRTESAIKSPSQTPEDS